jgi:hypothetical protein
MIERTSREVNRHGWGVCERALELPLSWKDLSRIAKAKTGIGKSDLPGLQGARGNVTVSFHDPVRAPRLYPDPGNRFAPGSVRRTSGFVQIAIAAIGVVV